MSEYNHVLQEKANGLWERIKGRGVRLCELAVLAQSMEHLLVPFMEFCESPIETTLLDAMIYLCVKNGIEIHITPGVGFSWPTSLVSDFQVEIFPQHNIQKYRVDFLVVTTKTSPSFTDDPVDGVVSSRIVVECDGHDFHERTKAQATRDKKRDRVLQKMGYKVFRFTGSEIFKNPIGSANEIVGEIIGMKMTEEGAR